MAQDTLTLWSNLIWDIKIKFGSICLFTSLNKKNVFNSYNWLVTIFEVAGICFKYKSKPLKSNNKMVYFLLPHVTYTLKYQHVSSFTNGFHGEKAPSVCFL